MKTGVKILLVIGILGMVFMVVMPFLTKKSDERFRSFYSRNFYKPNPTIKRNSSYDTRSGIRPGEGGGIFGKLTGTQMTVNDTGVFYGNDIIDNANLYD